MIIFGQSEPLAAIQIFEKNPRKSSGLKSDFNYVASTEQHLRCSLFAKISNGFWSVTIFAKRLHRRSWNGF